MRRTPSIFSPGSPIALAACSALLAFATPPAASLAQNGARGDTVSAPIRSVHYDVTFTKTQADARVVDVAVTFETSGAAPVLLSLPAWTPGAYEISNFSRWVTDFQATAYGKPLDWEKVDYDTWRILPNGAKSVRAAFRYVADSLDNAMTWAKPDFLLFNGANLFPYAQGQPLEFPATVQIHTEPEWRVVTGMPQTAPRSYAETNYHDLVDMPFFVGRFDVDSMRIVDRWVRFASYPAGAITPPARATVWTQLEHVIPPEAKVYGDAPPWPNYTVFEIVDSTFAGASGLEHQSSHVDVLSPQYVGGDFQPSLYAHEIFHSWNVKRLRPADMWPYQYAHAQPTPWLWVSEGITDYYADLAEVRGGVVDERGFYALTAEKVNEVNTAAPVSLHDASLDTWVHPVDGTEYLYYPKGSLAGLALDILIRDASDNKHSLDDVMRGLYRSDYEKGRGFTSADWWNAVSAAAGGKSFAAFNARYVDGRAPFPWDSILALAGIRTHQERIPRLGVLTQQNPTGIVVEQIQDGSSAASAGVRPGDYLLSIGDIPVEDQQFGAKMRAKYGASAEGSPLPIKIRRGADTLDLAAKLQFAPGDITLEPDPAASPKAVRVRNGILKGSTD